MIGMKEEVEHLGQEKGRTKGVSTSKLHETYV